MMFKSWLQWQCIANKTPFIVALSFRPGARALLPMLIPHDDLNQATCAFLGRLYVQNPEVPF